MITTSKNKCNVCNKTKLHKVLDFGKKPIVHHLKKTPEAKEIRYNFCIATCNNCSHLQILKPINASILYQNYFTPSSWKNNWHVDLLLQKMVTIFNLKENDKILEVGSNDGYFLEKFRKKNFKYVYGIEPSSDVYKISKKKGLKVFNDFFSYSSVKKNFKLTNKFDMIFSRHVLEHISDLSFFFKQLNMSLKKNGHLVLEVPDHDMFYENYDYSFWEEHTNYFNKQVLEHLLKINNFRIIHHESTLYSGKSLILFAEKSTQKNKSINFLRNKKIVRDYKKQFNNFVRMMKNFLKKFNKKIYVYGCGARSCNFVNLTNLSKYIDGFIDDNRNKQNKFVPGCNLKIFSPESVDLKNSVILLGVNTENEPNIFKKLRKNKNVYSILPPSKHLPFFWKKLADSRNVF